MRNLPITRISFLKIRRTHTIRYFDTSNKSLTEVNEYHNREFGTVETRLGKSTTEITAENNRIQNDKGTVA